MMTHLVDIKAWEKKRKSTILVYMLLNFLKGVEQSADTATLWTYVTDVMKTNQPKLYYGLISVSVYILPMFLSSVVARYADKTRRIKLIIIITNFVVMTGSILYVIPWSPLFPFAGKLLNGGALILRPLMIGEAARSYPPERFHTITAYLVGAKAFAFVTGPCLVLPFKGVNIWLGNLQITYGNISGVILLILTIIVQFFVIFFAHDLSREYDMKKVTSETMKQEETGNDAIEVLKNVLKSKMMLFMLIMAFSNALLNIAFFRNFPVLVLDVLSMSYGYVSIGLTINGINVLLLYFGSIEIKIGNVAIYWVGVSSQTSVILLLIFQYIFVHAYLSADIRIVMLALYVVSLSVFEMSGMFLVVVFAKLISSRDQSYLESIRAIIMQIGGIVGACFGLIFLLEYACIFLPLFLIINLFLLFCLYLYKHDLIYLVALV